MGELRKWRGGLAWSRPGAGPEPEVLRVCRMPVGPARAEQKLARFLVKGLGSGFRLRGFILPLTLPHSVALKSCFASLGLSFLICTMGRIGRLGGLVG